MLQRLAGRRRRVAPQAHDPRRGERKRLVLETFRPVLHQPWMKWLLESPLHLVSIGVNYAQCERMLRIEGMADIGAFLADAPAAGGRDRRRPQLVRLVRDRGAL